MGGDVGIRGGGRGGQGGGDGWKGRCQNVKILHAEQEQTFFPTMSETTAGTTTTTTTISSVHNKLNTIQFF